MSIEANGPVSDNDLASDAGPASNDAGSPAEPLLSVVKGEPTPEELAALAAVVASLGAPEQAEPEKPNARHWLRRQQLKLDPAPGPGAWRRSRG